MMDKDLKAKWVAALRSGQYKQGENRLYNPADDSYCCLGVLHALTGVTGLALCKLDQDTDHLGYVEALDEYGALIGKGGNHLGIDLHTREYLAEMNDGVVSGNPQLNVPPKAFAEIADWIEANVQCTP